MNTDYFKGSKLHAHISADEKNIPSIFWMKKCDFSCHVFPMKKTSTFFFSLKLILKCIKPNPLAYLLIYYIFWFLSMFVCVSSHHSLNLEPKRPKFDILSPSYLVSVNNCMFVW